MTPERPGAEPAPRSDSGSGRRRCRTAVLAGPGPRIDGRGDFAALIPILGRSPLQRHAVQLARSGVERCVVLLTGSDGSADLEARCRRQLSEVPTGDMAVEIAHSAEAVTEGPEEREPLLLRVRAEGVYDPRLYRRVLDGSAPVALVDRVDRPDPAEREGEPGRVKPGAPDAEGPAGELQPLGMALVTPASLGEPAPDAPRITVDDIPAYLPSMRRTLRPYWRLITTPDDLKRAGDDILDATQKGVLDFPARYLHPAPENFLTRLFAPTPVTPNQITVVTGIIGFAAAWLFAAGIHGPALAIALLVNVLDGVDGKLARVKLLTSRFGDRLDHILDVLFEFAWYLGIGYGLSGGSVAGAPFRLAVGLIAVMLGNRAVSGVYKLVSGRQIHDHRAFDRAFRLVAGRRNIYVVTLVAGFLAERFSQAFTLCFAWAVLTLAVYVVRTAVEAVADFDGGAERAP